MTDYWDPKEQPLTWEQLANKVYRLGMARPEFVYTPSVGIACVYTEGSEVSRTPGCIVGHAVYQLTGKLVPAYLEGSIWKAGWVNALGTTDCPEAVFVKGAQSYQDDRRTWGDAVYLAREESGWEPAS